MIALIVIGIAPKIIPNKSSGMAATPDPNNNANKNMPITVEISEIPKVLKK